MDAFVEARDLLWRLREDADAADAAFRWPQLAEFNWALDFFDRVPRRDALALWIVDGDTGDQTKLTYRELSERSNQTANWLRACGVRRGDHVLLMLGNQVELWVAILAAIKLGAVIIPASTLLTDEDLADRFARGDVRALITTTAIAKRFARLAQDCVRVAVDGATSGFLDLSEAESESVTFTPDGVTNASDPLLLYFTSGTTREPKLVEHTHESYPVGHLSTLYWLGLKRGDVHLNISSPGWAKHAWSSVFAPWNAEATIFVFNQERFDAHGLLTAVADHAVTTLCGAPTVWRMLVQQDLTAYRVSLREVCAAGEPLNPEVIAKVQVAWGLTIRDGYGQTETTAQIGNPPGHPITPGAMGRPLPGYRIVLLDADGKPADEGEISIELAERPTGLMTGYRDDAERTADVMRHGAYHTGDIAMREPDGTLVYVGRSDDVFKASGYRISPFELESALIEHPAIAEAAVVPSPDAVRGSVPKAFIALASGQDPSADTAAAIMLFARQRLARYQRIRRIEFAELPKTISGKIRRVELRVAETRRGAEGPRNANEYWEDDVS